MRWCKNRPRSSLERVFEGFLNQGGPKWRLFFQPGRSAEYFYAGAHLLMVRLLSCAKTSTRCALRYSWQILSLFVQGLLYCNSVVRPHFKFRLVSLLNRFWLLLTCKTFILLSPCLEVIAEVTAAKEELLREVRPSYAFDPPLGGI